MESHCPASRNHPGQYSSLDTRLHPEYIRTQRPKTPAYNPASSDNRRPAHRRGKFPAPPAFPRPDQKTPTWTLPWQEAVDIVGTPAPSQHRTYLPSRSVLAGASRFPGTSAAIPAGESPIPSHVPDPPTRSLVPVTCLFYASVMVQRVIFANGSLTGI